MTKRSLKTTAMTLTAILVLSNFSLLGRPLRPMAVPVIDQYGIADATTEAGATGDDLTAPSSEMRGMIERFSVDLRSLTRSNPIEISPARQARLRQFYTEWLNSVVRLDFSSMSREGRIDYLLFKTHLDHELRQLDIRSREITETSTLVPFAPMIVDLEESRRRMAPLDSSKAAALLNDLKKQVDDKKKQVEGGLKPEPKGEAKAGPNPDHNPASPVKVDAKIDKITANRAAAMVDGLRTTLKNWNTFYNGYDPIFTWWMAEPYKQADQSLQNYATFLREKIVGLKPGDTETIIGNPIGREALMSELANEMIPYTPEELIAIARKELAWCDAEMIKASRELGYGDDWHKALEYVKTLYVEPGKQPQLIRDLALEAINFVDKNDLVTIPPLARESWRMDMMTPERQLVNPFFTGGETISVSYPTNSMSFEQKMMSMRGNNIHFARATVFHELIPGHHLQGFMSARYHSYRSLFNTPFGVEGWALYWEMLLWDMNFAKSPENRIGMLFWRMHRCARIIFSLGFHLGQMTPQECIDFLVNRVGHERDNATAEVRRSFGGAYTPLYQAAYLLGGLQLYALHKDLVGSGKMTNRAFHDAILKENSIPIEMVRASLTRAELNRDFKPDWKFYGPTP